MWNAFSAICLWLEGRGPSVPLFRLMKLWHTLLIPAATAPYLLPGRQPPLPPPESFWPPTLLEMLSLVPCHPGHALNSRVPDTPQDGSAVMAAAFSALQEGQAGGEEEELPFSPSACGWSTQSSIWGWTEHEGRACRAELASELSAGPAMVDVCCRPPAEGEIVRPRTAGKIPCPQSLVCMEDFNHPSICWGHNRAWPKQSMRPLGHTDHILPTWATEEQTQRGVLLDTGELVRNVKVRAALPRPWDDISGTWEDGPG